MQFFLLSLLSIFFLHASWEKIVYPLGLDPIDVVIPCAAKDTQTLELAIDGIRKYGANIGRIIVISEAPLTLKAEWFDEKLFPFNKESVALEIFEGDERLAEEFTNRSDTRIGWIYQQILKLYASFTIPNLSPNILILDSDAIFMRPVSFLGKGGEPLFAYSKEITHEYLAHAARLLPGFKRAYPEKSGVAHHMLFQKPILEDLFETIRAHHGTEPWKAIVRSIRKEEVNVSSMSEYEIYFNFALLKTDQATLRYLKCTNVVCSFQFEVLSKCDWDLITSHSWSRFYSFDPLKKGDP
jgi:hypothetical protein